MIEPTGLIELPAQCDCPQRDVGIHGYLCPTIIKFLRWEAKSMDHDARDRADYEEMHREDVRWEQLLERERALERQLAEAHASLAEGDKRYAAEIARQSKVILELKERLAAAESKEVCTVAHDDSVLGVGEPTFCPYCEIERLISEGEEMRQVRLKLYEQRDEEIKARDLWSGLAWHRQEQLIAANELLSLCRSSVERDGRPQIVARIDAQLAEPQP